jgi:hypothetical protein
VESTLFSGLSAPETIGLTVAAVLTLIVFSYLWRDNRAYRLAEHVFIGTTVGYVFVVVYHQVLLPKLIGPGIAGRWMDWRLIVPAVLALCLLLRGAGPLGVLANWGVAFVVGVGSALALAGALSGTLLPQVTASAVPLAGSTGNVGAGADWASIAGNLVLVVGVLATLSYFYFTATRQSVEGRLLRGAGFIGKYTMMVAFGALFASLTLSRLSLLIGRLYFLLGDWLGVIR